MTKNDYQEFLRYLDYEGLNVNEYLREFLTIRDKLNGLCFLFSGTRLKFKEEREVFGIKILGLVMNGCPGIKTYENLFLAVYSDNDRGFVSKRIPYDLKFVDRLLEIVKEELH